jgi:thiamine pyrophosphate-dependent acetolactate synthase large subunit-like protein
MTRIEAIKEIMGKVRDNDVVISSNGMVSRETYAVKDRPLNFYVLGSMGCALAIGIGIAYTRPDLTVHVINGDGAAIMSLNTMLLQEYLKLRNLRHYILDNSCHATTGGQKTISFALRDIKFPNTKYYYIERQKGDSPRVPLTPEQISRRFRDEIIRQQEIKTII